MRYKSVYEDCENLALHGVAERKHNGSEYLIYVDPFGCDFKLYYYNTLCIGTGRMEKFVRVYLGGREVYAFDESNADKEYLVDGHWKELVTELWHYELAKCLEEPYAIKDTLLELCRRESAKYREFFERYRDLCSSLAKKYGILKISNGKKDSYELKKGIDGRTIEIYLDERIPTARSTYWSDVELFFDKEFKFRFCWNCSAAGSLFDDNGKYVPGEWEKFLEKLTDEL